MIYTIIYTIVKKYVETYKELTIFHKIFFYYYLESLTNSINIFVKKRILT